MSINILELIPEKVEDHDIWYLTQRKAAQPVLHELMN